MSEQKNQPDKMDLTSMNVAEDKSKLLKSIFPSVFTETVNSEGDVTEAVDVDKLLAEIGTFTEIFEARRERYGMDWPGKKDCLKIIQEPSRATLRPYREESVNFDTTENLFIEGDNLEVLKLLQKAYYSKVKMIYIDPPYNTGKEFIYPDKFAESLETYLAYAGLVDDEDRKFSTNTPTEGRYHTKWLNMMYPRLYLARNLLRNDGIIFVSIDEVENQNLRFIMNNIFGEDNFIVNVVWQKRTSPDARTAISEGHENIIIYAKNIDQCLPQLNKLPLTESQIAKYTNPDNDPRGPWVSSDFTAQGYRPNQMYPIITPGGAEYFPPEGRCWKNIEESFKKQVDEGRFWFGADGKGVPRRKTYLSEVDGRVPWTWWPNNEVGHTQEAKKEVNALFGKAEVYMTPKPVSLIKRMLEISTSKGDIILDFFAGSCSTANAVLNQNLMDLANSNVRDNFNNRKYIMIQLPERIDPSDKGNAPALEFCAERGLPPNLAEIAKERIRLVVKQLQDQEKNKDLAIFNASISDLDLGFKVLKLDRSNFKIWDGKDPEATEEELGKTIEAFVEHIDPEASQEDILYELLLKSGFMPTVRIDKQEMAGKTVNSIENGALLICLEDEITKELISAMAEAEPQMVICLDKGFKGNDQLKVNAVQTFKARHQGDDKEAQIVFRTV